VGGCDNREREREREREIGWICGPSFHLHCLGF